MGSSAKLQGVVMNWNEWFVYDETSPTCLRRKKVSHNDRKNKVGDAAGYIGGDGYYLVRVNGKKAVCHRIVWEMLNSPLDQEQKVDHKDRNRLNNKISNLRLFTNSQNGANSGKLAKASSKLKGVTFHKRVRRWSSRITVNYNQINLGYFDTEQEAAEMYDNAAIWYFGEFANTNFGNERYKERCSGFFR